MAQDARVEGDGSGAIGEAAYEDVGVAYALGEVLDGFVGEVLIIGGGGSIGPD